MGYFSKGRHRQPTNTARNAAAVAVAGALSATGMLAGTGTALAGPPGGWGPIIDCESGGRPTVQNSSSTASGLFQFINGTWAAYGGLEFAPTAKQATVEEQYIVAERAYAREGTRPWNASKSCWAGRTGEAEIQAAPERKPEPAVRAEARVEAPVEQTAVIPRVVVPEGSVPTLDTPPGNYTVVEGDTLSGIAFEFDTTWQELAVANHEVVEHADWIFPGEQINLPAPK